MSSESSDVELIPGFDKRLARNSAMSLFTSLPSMVVVVVKLSWRAAPVLTFWLIVAQAVAGIVSGLTILSVGTAITTIVADGSLTFQSSVTSLIPVALLVAGRGCLESAILLTQSRLTPRVNYFAETSLFVSALNVDLDSHDDPDWHEALTRSESRAVRFVDLSVGALVELIGATVGLVAIASSLAVLHPVLFPIVVASVIPQGYAALASGKLAYVGMFKYAAVRHKYDLITSLIVDRVAAAEIRANGAIDELHRRIESLGISLRAESERVERAQARVSILGRTGSGVIAALAVIVLLILLADGQIPVGGAGAAAIALTVSRQSLARIVMSANRLNEYGLYLRDFDNFLALSSDRAIDKNDGSLEADELIELKANSVSFKYRGADEEALKNVGFKICKGEVVAIVGRNGSGKSTLAKVLLGLYLPSRGVVSWNGKNLYEFRARSYRVRLGLIAQRPIQWPFTLRENVELGVVNGEGERLDLYEKALGFSGTASLRDKLPNGDDTVLSRYVSGGAELSGGQWQSLSIARGLYRSADLLICDEPTSALDPIAEAELYRSFRSLAESGKVKALVLISHRLASARWADRIYVMDSGKVIEEGAHSELIAADGAYAEMFRLQASGYVDSDEKEGVR